MPKQDPMNHKIFQSPEAARTWLEALLWQGTPACGYCGVVGENTPVKGRAGYYQCNACRKQFTVMVGTVFERSHIPLNKWLMAAFLLCASKKGISAHQIHRMIGITYKSAWFMMHRLREAMVPLNMSPLGGEGKTVEADTTFVGGKERNKHRNKRNSKNIGGMGKIIVHTLVERGGRAHSNTIANVAGKTLRPVVMQHVSRKSTFMTDTHGVYMEMGKEFARHEMVDHGIGEYVRGDAHSNTVESYFATLKRGIVGVYHHVSEAHIGRYLAEFDYRHSNRSALGITDVERTKTAIRGIVGKRLTYRRTNEAANA